MPPEVLSHEDTKSSPAIDIWALGVIMFQLFTGKLPFTGQRVTDIKNSIINSELVFPEDVQVPLPSKDLIGKMLCKDRKRRIQMSQILENQWLFPLSQEDRDANTIEIGEEVF